jgi:hypothetical protein
MGQDCVKVKTKNGSTIDISNEYPIGPTYLGRVYAAGYSDQVKREAQGLLKANKVNPQDIFSCVLVGEQKSCKNDGRSDKCVDIVLKEAMAR